MAETLDVGVRGLVVFTDEDTVYVTNGSGNAIRVRTEGEKLLVRLEAMPTIDYTAVINKDIDRSFEVSGVVVGRWDEATVVVCNEAAARCTFLITTDDDGIIITDMNRGARLLPAKDVEVTFSAD